MEHLIEQVEAISQKRVRQIAAKLERLVDANDADAFLGIQDICCLLESYMRALRQMEHQVVEGWRDAYGGYSVTDDDFHFPDCLITWDGEILRIRLGGILPFKTKLRCDLLCEELEDAIRRYVVESGLEVPVFQRAVVLFLHHCCDGKVRVRDYDNLERKGVLDALVPLLITDDNPRNIHTCDFMIADEDNFTEILLMDWTAFQRLVCQEEFAF